MKALLLNGSPHTEGGVHITMLRYLEEGLREAGAEVSKRNLYKLDIKPCLGCTSCWSRTPGRCVQDDEMRSLLTEVALSDILVLATPVYVDGMTGPTKVFLDRLVPRALALLAMGLSVVRSAKSSSLVSAARSIP